MKLPKGNGFAAIVALVWAASAIASIALRDGMGAVLLMWFPSAIAVSALYLCRKGERLPVILALTLGNLMLNLWFGLDATRSAGYVVANLAEPLIVVAVAKYVVGRRGIKCSAPARHGADVPSAWSRARWRARSIALPFRPQQDVIQFAWWVLATMLGTTVGAPIVLFLHEWVQKLRRGAKRACSGTFPSGSSSRWPLCSCWRG